MNGETLGMLLDKKMDDYVDSAVARIARADGFTGEPFIRQAHQGFANVVRSAIDGDMNARDRYIEGMIQSMRDQGLELDALMSGMVETTALLTSWAVSNGAGDSLDWLIQFLGDYTRRLAEVYAQ